jgi:2-hydroxymuconate-semialdehyde hydrolase
MGIEQQVYGVGGGHVSALVAGQGIGADGGTVLLLHGIPTSAHLWAPVLQRLDEAGQPAVAVDLPGYGTTRPEADDWSLAGAAALLAAWLADAAPGGAWVVGHDAGGAVAQILAVADPEVVTRLTLVNSIVDGAWPAPRARFATAVAGLGLYRPAAALRLVPNPYLAWQLRRGFAQPARMDAVDQDAVFWDGKYSDPDGRRAFQRHLAALDPADTAAIVPGLRDLDVPCQVVWGMQDGFQPWERVGRRLVELLPDPAVTTLDDCGHFVPLECPGGLVDAMFAWQAEVAT